MSNNPNLSEVLDSLTPEQRAVIEANMRTKKDATLSFKVSEKGCVSLYGVRWRGIHFYANEWAKILAYGDAIRDFIRENADTLTFQDAKGEQHRGVDAPELRDKVLDSL